MFPVQEACARFCGYNWDVPKSTGYNFEFQAADTHRDTHTHNPKRVIFRMVKKIGTLNNLDIISIHGLGMFGQSLCHSSSSHYPIAVIA